MSLLTNVWIGMGVVAFISVLAIVYIILFKGYRIPVVVLRYVGNQDRPMLFTTRARKTIQNGVPRLEVKGYSTPIRDYSQEHYFPNPKSKHGGLILWEFEDGLLTPALPERSFMDKLKGEGKLTKEEQQALAAAQKFFQSKGISFEFDKQLYHDLKLKAVDDVDVEFMLQDIVRVRSNYSGGWRDFFAKYGGHLVLLVIAMLFLVGLLEWFEHMPEFAAQCYGAAQRSVETTLLEQAANQVAPPG